MGNLTTNFNKEEFRCPCCQLGDIAPETAFIAQKLRDVLGEPVQVNSGVRCVKHNKEVGGVNGSQHTKKLAADLATTEGALASRRTFARKMWSILKDLYDKGEIPQLGYAELYDTFVHIDTRKTKVRNKFNSKGLA